MKEGRKLAGSDVDWPADMANQMPPSPNMPIRVFG
jgi:hypothetical protein